MYLTKLPSGNWRVIVQHEGRKRSGTGPTKAAAQQIGASLLLELGAKPDLIGGHNLGALLDEHLRTQPMTEGARYDFRLIVRKTPPWMLSADLATIDPYTVERWYERLMQADGAPRSSTSPSNGSTSSSKGPTSPSNTPWSVHRVRKLHTLLRSAFARAVVWRWTPDNPIAAAHAPTPPDDDIDTPDLELTRALLTAADNYTPAFGTYIRVAANTGARRGEVCGLQWGDLDPDTRTLVIRRSVSFVPGKGLVVSATKTGKRGHRAIGLGQGVTDALKAHLERMEDFCAAPKRRLTIGPTTWIFTDDTRTPWTPAFCSHAFKQVRATVPGAEHVHLHALRHAVATRLLAGGVDVRTVAGRLGHSNANVTLKTYARFVAANDRAAADLLDD